MPVFLSFAESIQLLPDASLIVHIVVILLMVFLLNRILFRPINSVLETRESLTHGRSDEAKDVLRQVDEGLSNYERALREARIESYHTIEKHRNAALAVRQEKVSTVREEIYELVSNEKKMISHQTEDARRTLTANARQAAADVSTHILGRAISSGS